MKLNHLGLILILLSTTVSAQVAVKNDAKAVEIAEKCMKAMGGKSSWDNTKSSNGTFLVMTNVGQVCSRGQN